MVIKSCFQCKYHEIKKEENEEMTYCVRENCWPRFSKCVATKALKRFLEEENMDQDRPFSAIERFYACE